MITLHASTAYTAYEQCLHVQQGPLAAGMSRVVHVELRAAVERAGLDLHAAGAALRVATEVR
jgi:hypothetical protein